MRGCWGALTVTGLFACAGCAAQDAQRVRAHREWQALCRAMQTAQSDAVDGQHLDRDTRERLQLVAHEAESCVVWVATVTPLATKPNLEFGSVDSTLTKPMVSVGGGTGVLIDEGRFVLTNEHVIRGASTIKVRLNGGRTYSVKASAVLPGQDLALLRIDAGAARTVSFRIESVGKGTPVIAVGGPHFPPATRGRVGLVMRDACSLQEQLDPGGNRDYAHLLESTAELQPGFSGGPLLDEAGRLVGVNVATSGSGASARGYALPLTREMQEQIQLVARSLAR